ncbi:MAG: FtsX-like permease family protein [Phycisphaerae bacterium]
MRHWLQLGTRNWRARPGRTLLAVAAVALGVAVVVWVTGCYESVRQSIREVVLDWIGRSQITVEPLAGRWGTFSDDIVDDVAALPDVRRVTTRTIEFVDGVVVDSDEKPAGADFDRLEITGVDPAHESLFRQHDVVAGRMLRSDDQDAVLAEHALAELWGFGVGDALMIRRPDRPESLRRVTVVGLVRRRRATPNQLPMLWARILDVQAVYGMPHRIKGLDVILADASPERIKRSAAAIRKLAAAHRKKHQETLKVATKEAQLEKLWAAESLVRFILMLCTCVLLLTAFFIIAATMGMGVAERIKQIGLMRCVGVTPRQVAAVVLIESLPIGIGGVAAGLLCGAALQWATVLLAPEYVGELTFSTGGIMLAIAGGLLTAVLGAVLPALRAVSVSPVEATRPLAHPIRLRWILLALLLGAALLIGHHTLLRVMDARQSGFSGVAVFAVVLLYAGYTLLLPAAVVLFGAAAVRMAAWLLRLRTQMLGDEIQKSPWRSAAICGGLMVGLSMIVGLVVWADSVKAGWQFPKEFPEAMLYSWEDVPLDHARKLDRVAGVKDLVIADDFHVSFSKPGDDGLSFLDRFRSIVDSEKFSRFIALQPHRIPVALSLTYLEGDEAEALAKLEAGGHVLITRELSEARHKHLGDRLNIYYNDRSAAFTIAGVIAAPALDIAVNFFNATEYFQIYSVGAVFGSFRDAERHFGRRQAKLIVFNFNLTDDVLTNLDIPKDPAPPRPESEIPTKQHPLFGTQTNMLVAGPAEQAVVREMKAVLGEHLPYAFATAAQLKREIDGNLNRVTLLLSAVPLIGLLVAALGVGNLMMANVAARRREIGVLRALGTTRGQIMRMVLGEALILGLLGSAAGLALGLHLARASNTFTEMLAGIRPEWEVPWQLLSAGALLATGLCIAAGWIPARYAAKSSIVASIQDQ